MVFLLSCSYSGFFQHSINPTPMSVFLAVTEEQLGCFLDLRVQFSLPPAFPAINNRALDSFLVK